jgi:hypothetical protein
MNKIQIALVVILVGFVDAVASCDKKIVEIVTATKSVIISTEDVINTIERVKEKDYKKFEKEFEVFTKDLPLNLFRGTRTVKGNFCCVLVNKDTESEFVELLEKQEYVIVNTTEPLATTVIEVIPFEYAGVISKEGCFNYYKINVGSFYYEHKAKEEVGIAIGKKYIEYFANLKEATSVDNFPCFFLEIIKYIVDVLKLPKTDSDKMIKTLLDYTDSKLNSELAKQVQWYLRPATARPGASPYSLIYVKF